MARFSLFKGKEETRKGAVARQTDAEGKLSEDLFARYSTTQRADWVTEANSGRSFRKGNQWTKAQKESLTEEGLSPIVVNVIHPAVESLKASMTANPPQFTVTGRDMSDNKVASIFGDLISEIWQRSGGNQEVSQAIDDYIVAGLGVFFPYVNPKGDNGKPECWFKAVDPLDIWVDPSSRDKLWRDAAHILVSKIMTGEQLARMDPALEEILDTLPMEARDILNPTGVEDNSTIPGTDQNQDKFWVIDRFSKVKIVTHVITYPVTGEEWIASDQEFGPLMQRTALLELSANAAPELYLDEVKIRGIREYMEKFGEAWHYVMDPNDPSGTPFPVAGEEDEARDQEQGLRTIPGSTIRIKEMSFSTLLAEDVLVHEKATANRVKEVFSIGGVTVRTTIHPISHYPIIPLINNFERGNPYGGSDIKLVKELQVYVNKMRALILAHAANSAGVKLVIGRGSANPAELEKKMRRAGAAIIDVDLEMGAPVSLAPPPLPNELYLDEQRHRTDIQEILGAYTLSQGDPAGAPETYKGTLAIDEYGQRRIKNKKDDVEGALTQVARVVIEMIQKYYTEPRVLRLIKPNTTSYQAKINYYPDQSQFAPKINDLSVGRYDVIIITGSMLPVNRWGRFEYYKQLYELQIIDRLELLQHAEVIDVQGVAERMSEIEQLRAALQQAGEQIKELKGDLQTASRETMHAKQSAELTKYKGHLEGYRQKADAATTVFTTRLQDELANEKSRDSD